jgi:hypothetical protein
MLMLRLRPLLQAHQSCGLSKCLSYHRVQQQQLFVLFLQLQSAKHSQQYFLALAVTAVTATESAFFISALISSSFAGSGCHRYFY